VKNAIPGKILTSIAQFTQGTTLIAIGVMMVLDAASGKHRLTYLSAGKEETAKTAEAKTTKPVLTPADDTAIRQVLIDSQMLEQGLYRNPSNFRTESLQVLFLPKEWGGTASAQIETSAHNLARSGKRYGRGTKCLLFDIAYVRAIDQDTVMVSTNEEWKLVTEYDRTSRPADVRVLRLQNEYGLRRWQGRWVVEWTTIPYRNGISSGSG
jgi:hypothetical protein